MSVPALVAFKALAAKAAVAVAIALAALLATQPVVSSRPGTLCRHYQHEAVTARRGTASTVIRNDVFPGFGQCLKVGGDGSWAVQSTSGMQWGSENIAYPEQFYGWLYGLQSAGTILPRQVARLPELTTTWAGNMHARGKWGAGWDMWFSTHPQRTGQADAAEIMVWPNERAFPSDKGKWPLVRIEGQSWYVETWITGHGGKHWRYLQFHRANPVWHDSIRLRPFFKYAVQHGLLSTAWYLDSVSVGYEIWASGQGLGTRWFTVNAHGGGG